MTSGHLKLARVAKRKKQSLWAASRISPAFDELVGSRMSKASQVDWFTWQNMVCHFMTLYLHCVSLLLKSVSVDLRIRGCMVETILMNILITSICRVRTLPGQRQKYLYVQYNTWVQWRGGMRVLRFTQWTKQWWKEGTEMKLYSAPHEGNPDVQRN